jgi:putative Ca2+/H+ antiporter (TMEM165/GDT1 family)
MHSFNLNLFVSVFCVIFVAELPDKTALAALLMATRSRPLGIFLGAAAAFVVQSVVAVGFGSALNRLPRRPVEMGAGVLFLGLAVWMWIRRQEVDSDLVLGDEPGGLAKIAWMSFAVIFAAEWGDLTQLATATLVAKYGNPMTILVSAISALWAVTALVVLLGHRLKALVEPGLLKTAAALVLALVGVLLIARYP